MRNAERPAEGVPLSAPPIAAHGQSDDFKERTETPSSMQLTPHHGVLRGLKPLKDDTPCAGSRSITLIDGSYRQNLDKVDQNPQISHRLC
jgi:hypothetical protein